MPIGFFNGQLACLFRPAGQPMLIVLWALFAHKTINEIGRGARQGLAMDAARLVTGGVWRVDC